MEAPKKTNTATITWQVPLQAGNRLALPHDLLATVGAVHTFILVRHADGSHTLRPVRSEIRAQSDEQVVLEPDGTIALPFPYAYGVDEGTPFALTSRADGDIALQIIEERDPDQVSYWGEDWQRGERGGDADYATGRYKTFDDLESFLADLDADPEG